MTNGEASACGRTTEEAHRIPGQRRTTQRGGGGRLLLGASVSSAIFAAVIGPGCGSPPCEETLTCPPPANDGGETSSGGRPTAGGGGKAGDMGATSGSGGKAGNGGTTTGIGGTGGSGGDAGDDGVGAAGGEGTIDCGVGSEPDGNDQCVPAAQCRTENDCAGSCRTCAEGTCVAVKSADDLDSCAGTCDADGTCKSKRGQACALSGNGCIAGSTCADGYCCDAECGESCQACDVSGSEGTCTALKSGAPHGNRSTCGGEGVCAGSCSGRGDGKCNYPTSDCGNGPSCSGTDFVGQAKCSAGECMTPAARSCDGGFACVGTDCKASCSADAECEPGHFCQSGACHLDAIRIGVGGSTSVAVLSDGSLYAWGYNAHGEVGPGGPPLNGSGEPIQNFPIKVTGLPAGAKSVEAGDTHVCALLTNDEVWCWGSNTRGQLGNGTITTNYNPTPSKVSALPSGATAIATRENAICALIGSSGDVYCWGDNISGELGTNVSGASSATPTKVADLGKATQVTISEHACAIVGSTQYCWGANNHSQCGQPSSTPSITTPVALGFGLLGSPQQLSATTSHSCALLTGGNVYCWGWNVDGCLGDPSTDVDATVATPVQVSGLSGVTQIATSRYTDCAILAQGKVRCWGSQDYGKLGDGTIDPSGYSATPVEVGGVSNAVAIGSSEHTCVLVSNGSIKCWGQGALGQLGNSLSSNSAVAVDVTATW